MEGGLVRDHRVGGSTFYRLANGEMPAKYQVRGIPTVLLFRDGQAVERLVGAQPKQVLTDAIQKHLK